MILYGSLGICVKEEKFLLREKWPCRIAHKEQERKNKIFYCIVFSICRKELSKLPDSEETPPLPAAALQINVPSMSPDDLNTRGYLPPAVAAAAQISAPVPSPLPPAYIIG